MVAYEQLRFFAVYILNGMIIGIIFDLFRALRKTFKTPDIITYIEDAFFWIIAGIISIFFIFAFNQGEIRSYTILGIIFGVTIYILVFSKFVLKIAVNICKCIKQIANFILKPFIFIYKKITIIFTRFYKNI